MKMEEPKDVFDRLKGCRPALGVMTASAGLLLLSACVYQPKFEPARNTVPVNVFFDAEGCPDRVEPDRPRISKAGRQGIRWEARGPTASDIQIFFDPFVSAANQFNVLGRVVESGPVFPDAPSKGNPNDPNDPGIEYKYTILAADCPDKPLDPVLIVKN